MIQNVKHARYGKTGNSSKQWQPSPSGLCPLLRQKVLGSKIGQSLVEMAIALPLLLLMFLGVFEVGWALRGYMVMANANRETTRFAVKNAQLDYSEKNPDTVGYHEVLSHTLESLGYRGDMPFTDPRQRPTLPVWTTTPNGPPRTTIIMTHMVVDTGFPCVVREDPADPSSDPVVPYQFDANCNCNAEADDPQWFDRDDLVLHPESPGYSYYGQTFQPVSHDQPTRISGGSYETEAEKLRHENNQLNCVVLRTGGLAETSVNNLFISEMMYDQPQLLGVPLISNPLTNPIPFYTHTAMRIVVSREADTTDSIGPVCSLHPIAIAKQIFANPDSPGDNLALQLYQAGSGNPSFKWVVWDPAESSNSQYLAEALHNPRLAITGFTDSYNGDHTLSVSGSEEDQLVYASGAAYSVGAIDELMGQMLNQTIRVPVYDSGTNRIDHVGLLQVTSVITSPTREISAIFLKYDDQACQE